MSLDPARRAGLERARAAAIARAHLELDAELDSVSIDAAPFGVVVASSDHAVVVSSVDDLSVLGGVLVWLDRNDVGRADFVAEHHAGVHARRAAMLAPDLVVHELTSPRDYRQDRLAGEQVYFHPADVTAREAMDAIWADLSGGVSEPLTLTVKTRKVELSAFSNGVARARFYDLCGQPLGPADYIALADAVRVRILEDIPRLSAENYNQAKRFVTLVDALYEARVRLIATAADEPEKLYLEGAGSFEFERTASRLREMQAADWGEVR